MSVERNKAIVHRLFEVWNTGNLDAIEELYAADYVADYRPYAPLRWLGLSEQRFAFDKWIPAGVVWAV